MFAHLIEFAWLANANELWNGLSTSGFRERIFVERQGRDLCKLEARHGFGRLSQLDARLYGRNVSLACPYVATLVELTISIRRPSIELFQKSSTK